MNQVQASKERFEYFTERDEALVRWRFDKGYVAELAKRRYQKMFAGAKHILDVGCGVGEAAQWANGANYFGIDLSETLIREGIKHRQRFLTVASITALPFRDEMFDRVTCMGVLHHLSRDQIPAALKEMARVLQTCGAIAIIEPNPWNLYQRLFAYIRQAERGILHTSPFDLRCTIESIQGLNIEQFEYEHTMFWPSYGTFVTRRFSWLTGPRMTSFLLFLHRWVMRLTPKPLLSHTFWRLGKQSR